MAYFKHYQSKDVHSYNSEKKMWSILPQCSHGYCSLAVVNGLLTAIGGRDGNDTNQLLSLIVRGKWVEHFPPMPTAQSDCTGQVGGALPTHANKALCHCSRVQWEVPGCGRR